MHLRFAAVEVVVVGIVAAPFVFVVRRSVLPAEHLYVVTSSPSACYRPSSRIVVDSVDPRTVAVLVVVVGVAAVVAGAWIAFVASAAFVAFVVPVAAARSFADWRS